MIIIKTLYCNEKGYSWYVDGINFENSDICLGIFDGEVAGLNYNIDLRGKYYLIQDNYWPLPLHSSSSQCVIAPPIVVPITPQASYSRTNDPAFPLWGFITIACLGFGAVIGFSVTFW